MKRLGQADGSTHVRGFAFRSAFVFLSGFIGLVGLASALGVRSVSQVVQHFVIRLAPGPSGQLLQQAVSQGRSGGWTAALFGLGAALLGGTLAMVQVERSANRIDGRTEDRPPILRYLVAFMLALSAGVLLAAGGLVVAAGQSVGQGIGWSGTAATIWAIARWPLGVLIAAAATFTLFAIAPRTPLGPRRVVAAGALVAVALWLIFTAGPRRVPRRRE